MTAEIILLPGASSGVLPLYRPGRIAAKLAPLLKRKDFHAATNWWKVHIARVDDGMRKKRVPAEIRHLVIKEITGQVRLEILVMMPPAARDLPPARGGDAA